MSDDENKGKPSKEELELMEKQVKCLDTQTANVLMQQKLQEESNRRAEKTHLTRTENIRMNAIGNSIAMMQRAYPGEDLDDRWDTIMANADLIYEWVTRENKLN